MEWFEAISQSKSKEQVWFLVVVIWSIWKARNSREFQGRSKSVEEVASEISGFWERWRKVRHEAFGSPLPSCRGGAIVLQEETVSPREAVLVCSDGAIFMTEGSSGSDFKNNPIRRGASLPISQLHGYISNPGFTYDNVMEISQLYLMIWLNPMTSIAENASVGDTGNSVLESPVDSVRVVDSISEVIGSDFGSALLEKSVAS
ncbi:hypothetical protein RIF29_37854 [Crotalaria pallida]|uniref:Uncharacterized protein n=1 Tax=Crotalaria pallida TaxID=3830 RepID=A0AAN9E3M6_CROPI